MELQTNPDTGHYLQTPDNISLMFQYLKTNVELLEPHQQDFIASMGGQFVAKGRLSEKQFAWLTRYYTAVQMDLAGAYEDCAYDSYDDSHPGHPSHYGDN